MKTPLSKNKMVVVLGIAGSIASIVAHFDTKPATNFAHITSYGDNSPIQTFYGGNNNVSITTTAPVPSAVVGPASKSYTFVSEDAARSDLDFALNTQGDLGSAIAILKGFPTSTAREEECERVFGYAVKRSRRNDAGTIARECFEGQHLSQALQEVSTIHTQEN